jgi:succinate dehydrogenase / fumarate reductase, cytochrome b subunit
LATRSPPARPLSPHLSIWKWGPHMLVSILHRATGSAMATVGTILFVWFLLAAAAGKDAYGAFLDPFTYSTGRLNIIGYLFGIGLTWAFTQHMLSGIRHFFLDTGAGYELKTAKLTATATLAGSTLLTVLYWAYLVWGK